MKWNLILCHASHIKMFHALHHSTRQNVLNTIKVTPYHVVVISSSNGIISLWSNKWFTERNLILLHASHIKMDHAIHHSTRRNVQNTIKAVPCHVGMISQSNHSVSLWLKKWFTEWKVILLHDSHIKIFYAIHHSTRRNVQNTIKVVPCHVVIISQSNHSVSLSACSYHDVMYLSIHSMKIYFVTYHSMRANVQNAIKVVPRHVVMMPRSNRTVSLRWSWCCMK